MPSFLTTLTDWILTGITGIIVSLAGYARRVDAQSKSALELAQQNERKLEGDPNDPNAEGVLQIAYETRQNLREYRDEMRQDHREVMRKLEELEERTK